MEFESKAVEFKLYILSGDDVVGVIECSRVFPILVSRFCFHIFIRIIIA